MSVVVRVQYTLQYYKYCPVEMAALKKRSGAPEVKYYEQSDTIGQFEPIRLWLVQNYDQYTHADPPSNKALATLTCSLLQFQDEVFGQHSKNRPLTKLPVRFIVSCDPKCIM